MWQLGEALATGSQGREQVNGRQTDADLDLLEMDCDAIMAFIGHAACSVGQEERTEQEVSNVQ